MKEQIRLCHPYRKKWVLPAFILLVVLLFTAGVLSGKVMGGVQKLTGIGKGYTVSERLEQYGPAVEQRMRREVEAAGLQYPPEELTYIAFKDTARLEVYGRMSDQAPWRFIRAYPVRKASGTLGPKLAEGDYQVPEGIYQAEFLNANSRFHLSIRLNYPNTFDREMARRDGRTRLGGDIMIHGGAASIGCLAMGDEAAEDLFILAALVSKEKLRIVVSPTDYRLPVQKLARTEQLPEWASTLYASIRKVLNEYPLQTHGRYRAG